MFFCIDIHCYFDQKYRLYRSVSIFSPVIKNHATATAESIYQHRRRWFLPRWCSVLVAQKSNGATSGQAMLRCGDSDMRKTSVVNRMAQWWGGRVRGVCADQRIRVLVSTLGRKLAHFPYTDAHDGKAAARRAHQQSTKNRYFKGKYRYISIFLLPLQRRFT